MIIKKASDIKYMYELNNPDGHMFDRKTMKFFGDTMSNFHVPIKHKKAVVISVDSYTETGVQCYILERRHAVKGGLNKPFYFEVGTFRRVLSKDN